MTNQTTAATAETITNALAVAPGSTAADLAATTGLGRSTVTKHLAALERDGHVSRTAGEQDGPRRKADRWNLATTAQHAPAAGERLRPGQLDTLVLDRLAALDEPAGPTAVAKALGRSSGAVANCMTRLTATGRLKQVSDRPRRYEPAP